MSTTAQDHADRIAAMLADGEARSMLANPDEWTVNLFNGGGPARSGVTVNANTAMGASAVFACVRNIAEDVAKLPLIVYRAIPQGGKERLPGHPLYRLLHDEPNPEMTAFDCRQAITASAVLLGDGYAEIERFNDGTPRYLWPIERYRVRVRRGPDKRLFYEIDGGRARLALTDMLHVKGFSTNGILGEMIVSLGRESMGLMLAAERFAAAFFGNGTQLSGVLEYPKVMKEEAQKVLRQSWMEMHSGPDNAHKPAILEDGMKWTKTSAEPNEAQMIETRQFQVEDVARWFRMPPHKIGHLERATGWSTLDATNTDYVIDTLMPWFVRWEQESKRKLIAPADVTMFAEHLVNGLLRGDSTSRATFYEKMRNMGVINADDIAEMENLNPLPEGQGRVYLVPSNFMNAKRAAAMDGSTTDPTVKPAPGGTREVPPAAGGAADRPDAAAIARPALLDAAARVVRREIQVLTKGATSRAAVAKFFEGHADYVRTAFAPALDTFSSAAAALAVGTSAAARPADVDLTGYARELGDAVEAGTARDVLARWEREKAQELVTHIIRGATHAREK